MYKKQITYIDLDGNERTENLYFRLSESEIADMQYSVAGGFANMLMEMINKQDVPAIMEEFKKFIMLSYGEKTPDGRGFIKVRDGHRLADDFIQTEAYNKFYMTIMNDPEEIVRFVNGIFPKDMMEKGREVMKSKELTDNPTTQKMIEMMNASVKNSGDK